MSLLALELSICPLFAEVRPHPLFSEGAVLQAGVPLSVWGTARDGEKISIEFQGQKVSTTAKGGEWKLELKPLKHGGPFSMRITGDNKLEISNVLVGEVWLCSGQSNMAFQLYRAGGAQEAIAAAADPSLRFFFVPHHAADAPRTDVESAWRNSSPTTASNFSAVAYFFGRELRRTRKVPVGLIDASVGGTPAEAWTSRPMLESNPELAKILERHADSLRTWDPEKARASFEKAKAGHKGAVAKAKAEGKSVPRAPTMPADPARSSKRPTGLYNAMIAPLQPFALAGVIWYQGEGNVARAQEYQMLFPALIQDWRKGFGEPDMPFFFVQIAPHERMSPEIREAQLLTALRVPNTAIVVTTDIGNATDIHPTRKREVGERLALCARALRYSEKIEYSGPMVESVQTKGETAILAFSHGDGGLVAKGGELRGFEIADESGVFHPAAARIQGKEILVVSPKVSKPTEVRYAWETVPNVNLFNGAGLPASPFRIKAAGK